jgi:hypothetical protein
MRNRPLARACDFVFDEPLMTSDAGLLLLAEHAARSDDIARIADALAPKRKPRARAQHAATAHPACPADDRRLR